VDKKFWNKEKGKWNANMSFYGLNVESFGEVKYSNFKSNSLQSSDNGKILYIPHPNPSPKGEEENQAENDIIQYDVKITKSPFRQLLEELDKIE
jgi:hypothetical protein